MELNTEKLLLKYQNKIDIRIIEDTRFEFFLLKGIITLEDLNFDLLFDFIEAQNIHKIPKTIYKDKLYNLFLIYQDHRESLKNDILGFGKELVNYYLNPDSNRYNNLRNLIQKARGRILHKGILVYFFISDTIFFPNNDSIIELLKKTKRMDSKYFLYDILDEIALANNLTPKLSPQEKENADLRTSLEISIQEIDDLKSEIEEVKEVAKNEALISFLRELNSKGGNNLLDQFSISSNTIKKLKKEKYQFPDEIQSIPVVVRMFMQFINDLGVTPITNIEGMIEIDLKESENFDYVGTPFIDDQKKKVIIETPGWKYGEQIITKPRIKELL